MNPGSELIRLLGGAEAVAKACGRERSSVNNWPGRRIPPEHFGDLIRLGKSKRVRLSLDRLEAINLKLELLKNGLTQTKRKNGARRNGG